MPEIAEGKDPATIVPHLGHQSNVSPLDQWRESSTSFESISSARKFKKCLHKMIVASSGKSELRPRHLLQQWKGRR